MCHLSCFSITYQFEGNCINYLSREYFYATPHSCLHSFLALWVTHILPIQLPPQKRLAALKGSASPILCPSGSASDSFGLASESDCSPCDPGYYCPGTGSNNLSIECQEGYYCPGGDAYPTRYSLFQKYFDTAASKMTRRQLCIYSGSCFHGK